MEQVLEYSLVTAEGEQVTVTEGAVTGLEEGDPRAEVDILTGLRGAGGSFGVVTQFLVSVHPSPETLASVVPVWVSSAADLANVQRAAESSQGRGFQFGLYSLYYHKAMREPWRHPLLWASQMILRLQTWAAGEPGIPLVISVADIRSADCGQRWILSFFLLEELVQAEGLTPLRFSACCQSSTSGL